MGHFLYLGLSMRISFVLIAVVFISLLCPFNLSAQSPLYTPYNGVHISGAGISENPPYGFNGYSGPAVSLKLYQPHGGVFYNGDFYFADRLNHIVRKISPDGFSQTVAGTGRVPVLGEDGKQNGPALQANLDEITAVDFDPQGNMYISGIGYVFKVSNGIISRYDVPEYIETPNFPPMEVPTQLGFVRDMKWLNGEIYIATYTGLFVVDRAGYINKVSRTHFVALALDKNKRLYGTTEEGVWRIFNDKSMKLVYAPTSTDVLNVDGSTLEDTSLKFGAMVFDANNALIVYSTYTDQIFKIYDGNKIKWLAGRPGEGIWSPRSVNSLNEKLAIKNTENGEKIWITLTNGHSIYEIDNPQDPGIDWGEENIDVDGSCGLDATTDGELFSCNPVNIATGTKVDYSLDVGHNTPYPIMWGRYYHSKKGEWTFEYQRHIKATTKRLEMHRPDGVVLVFKRANNKWVIDMGNNRTVVNAPVTIQPAETLMGYEYRNLKDEIERYDATGKLLSIESKEGWRLTMQYDGFNRLSKVLDVFHRGLDLTYTVPTPTSPSVLKTVSDGERTVSYTYEQINGKTVLTKVTRPDNKVVTYKYDDPTNPDTKGKGLLTEIVDENGAVFARYQYDMFGRATQTLHDPDGLKVNKNEFFYDDAYGAVDFVQNGEFNTAFVGKNTHTNGASKPRNITSPCFSCQGTSLRRNNYDQFGNPVEQFDFNNVKTQNVYDTTRALPTEITKAVGTPGQNTTQIEWHPTWRLPTQIVEEKNINNALVVQVTTNTYNANGQLIFRTLKTNPGEEVRTLSITYNDRKLPHVVTDPMGRQTIMQYDNQANLSSVTNAIGQTTTYGNYTVSGVPRLITLPNGLQRKLTLNPNQQITQIDEGSPTSGWRSTLLEYDNRGLLKKTTYPNGAFEENTYDTARRLVKVKDNQGERALVYDEYSKLIKEVVVSTTPGVTLQTEKNYTYNSNGRVEQEKTLDELAYYSYDTQGNVVSKVSNGLSTTYTYDEFNQLTKESFTPDGYIPDSPSSTTRAYYANGLLKSATDERGVVTTYYYNGFGEVNKIASPDGGQKVLERNKAGEVTKITDARGVVTALTRDNLGRVTAQLVTTPSSAPGLMSGTQTQQTVYDNCSNGAGMACSVQNYSGTVSYTYNVWQDVVGKTFTPANTTLSFHVGYTFDAVGNLVSTTYPSGRSAVSTFQQGRTKTITFDAHMVASDIQYYPFDLGVSSYQINGRLLETLLNESGNPKNIKAPDLNNQMFWNNAGRDFALNAMATYSGGGSVGSRHFAKGYLNKSAFALNQEHALYPKKLTYEYSYDLAGNRTKKSVDEDGVINYTYAPNSNRLQSTALVGGSSATYQYDGNGNTISGNGWTYTYDGENRLREASSYSTAHFEYNALGQRVKKDGWHGTEYFVHDEQGRILGVYNEQGVSKEEIVWMDGWRPVATARGTGINTQLYFIEVDHLNAPLRVLNQSNQIVWSWDLREAFGYHAPNEDVDGNGTYFEFNLRFPGQWFDKETGLFHNGFRDYNPSTGRYMQSDPLGLEAGFNTYAYVGSNPLRAVDPYGLLQKDGNGNITEKSGARILATHGKQSAYMRIVHLTTDKGRDVRALKWLSGDPGLKKNCHGFALGVNYWIDDPTSIYEDEYERVKNYEDADVTFFLKKEGGLILPQKSQLVPKHSGINTGKVGGMRGSFGKWGGEPSKFSSQLLLESYYGTVRYYRKKDEIN